MRFNEISNWLFTLLRVTDSVVDGLHSAVIVGGEGAVAGFDEAETAQNSPEYGVPGIVFRPRPPSTHDGDELVAESVALRFGENVYPLSWRDLRLNRRFPNPKPGTIALIGYGGGFLSFDDAAGPDGSITTLYCPYDYDGGTAGKAHAIVLDPTSEAISIVHGDGLAVVLTSDGITLRADESTWLKVSPGKIELVAASISARGIVALGADTAAALPLMPGMASQPTPSVFFSVT